MAGMVALVMAASAFLGQRARTEADAALNITVVARQWWWEFDYPGADVKVANELHLPADRPVRLTLTSADVLHSFALPGLGINADVVPGQPRTLLLSAGQAGVMNGSCGAGCGCQTVCMRFKVLVTSESEFESWLQKQRGVPLVAGNTATPQCANPAGAPAPRHSSAR